MKPLIIFVICFSFLFQSFGQGKAYYLTGQSDSLFVEMVFFKKNDSIFFYIFDNHMNHVNIPGLKGNVNFVFGKNAAVTIKLDPSKYNSAQERIQISLPKEYWEGFKTCELHLSINSRMMKFTIFNNKIVEEQKHHDTPIPGGHSH